MSKHIEFVKSQVSFHEIMADKYKVAPKRRDKHLETAAHMKDVLEHLVFLEATKPMGVGGSLKKAVQLSLTFEELEGLPKELIQELSVSDGDRTDFAILRAIESASGVASLDRILVGLYRETEEVMKRSTLTSRIYRMTQKGLLYQVPGKKGVYSLEELTQEQVDNLFSK